MNCKIIIALLIAVAVIAIPNPVKADEPTMLQVFNAGKYVYTIKYDDEEFEAEDEESTIKYKYPTEYPDIVNRYDDSINFEWSGDNLTIEDLFTIPPSFVWMKDIILVEDNGKISMFSYYFDTDELPAGLEGEQLIEYWNEMQSEAVAQFEDYAVHHYGEEWDTGDYSITGRFNSNPFS